MIAIILALSWPLTVVEPEYVPAPCYPCNMPTQVNLPTDTAIADSFMVGRPQQFQDPYRAAAERYPLEPTLPRYRVPIEEEIATNEIVQRRQARDIGMKGALLDQKVREKNFDYDNSIVQQAESAIPMVGRLNPSDADFPAQRAALLEQYPLAAQNPAFNSMIGRLDATHAQQQQNREILNRNAQEEDARAQFAEDQFSQRLESTVASAGPEALKIYQDAMRPEPGKLVSADQQMRAFAKASQYIAQQQAAAKAQSYEDRPMTPQQVRNARNELIREIGKWNSRKTGIDTKDSWTDTDEQILQSMYGDLNSLNANPGSGAAQPVQKASPQSFFPKPSTKTGP